MLANSTKLTDQPSADASTVLYLRLLLTLRNESYTLQRSAP
jgi:hypothetical protein